MAKRKNNRNNKRGNVVSVAGVVYLIKNLGGVVLKHGSAGQPIYEIQAGNLGNAAKAIYENAKDLNLTDIVVDGFKIGAVRKLGLGVTIMSVGTTRVRSV